MVGSEVGFPARYIPTATIRIRPGWADVAGHPSLELGRSAVSNQKVPPLVLIMYRIGKAHVAVAVVCLLLRLITKLSKRECGMIQQAFKYERFKDGSKKRFKLAPDSQVPCAEIFSLP